MKLYNLLILASSATMAIPSAGAAPDLGVEPVIPGGRDAPAATKADWCQGFQRGQNMDLSIEPRQRGVSDNLGSVAWFACEEDKRWTRAESARDNYLAMFPGLTAHDFSEVMAAYRDLDKAQARDQRLCEKLGKAVGDLEGRVRYAISCDWKQLEPSSTLAIALDRPGDTGSIAVRIARRYACGYRADVTEFASVDGRCAAEVVPLSRDELERDLASRPMLQRIDLREAWARGNRFGVESKARVAKASQDRQTVAASRTEAARAWATAYSANPKPVDQALEIFEKIRGAQGTSGLVGCSNEMRSAFAEYLRGLDTTTEAFLRAMTAPVSALVWRATYACALVDELPLGLAMTVTQGLGSLGAAKGKDDDAFRQLGHPSGPRFSLGAENGYIDRLAGRYSPDVSEGVIASIKKVGKDQVSLTFKRERISVPEMVLATGGIDGIDANGKFTRSMFFKYTGKMLKRDVTAKPIVISATVAKSLKAGMYLRLASVKSQSVVMVGYASTAAKVVVMLADTPTR